MNKKSIGALLLLVSVLGCSAMEPTDDNPMYLEYPEEYENFRLTRSYGSLHFGCLAEDIVEGNIIPLLSPELEIKLKHTFLRYKGHCSSDLPQPLWQPIPLDISPFDMEKWKVFGYHDGTYTLVPADFDYASCDYGNEKYKRKILARFQETSEVMVKILCHKSNSNVSIYCPTEEVRHNDKHSLYAENDCTTEVRELSYNEKIHHHLLSNDGKWLLVCSDHCASYRDIINGRQLKEIIFSDPIVGACAAHTFPFFMVYTQNQVCLINPVSESNQNFDFSSICAGVNSIHVSPSDTYLAMIQKGIVCIFNANNLSLIKKITTESAIKRALFVSDDIIILATDDEQLWFCNHISQCAPTSYWESRCRWRYPSNTMHITNLSPALVFGSKSNLLFSLDPVDYGNCVYKCTIAKVSDGTSIASLKIFPNNPVTMALTYDERLIVFMHADDTASTLELYDQQETAVLDFITKKPNVYTLCCLWALHKNYEKENALSISDAFERFMNKIRSLY